MRRPLILLVGIVALAACSDSSSGADVPSFATMVASDASRPFTVFTPSSYLDDTPMPLVILLHRLGGRGEIVEAGTLDLDSALPGEETVLTRVDGCPDGIGLELWTVRGGSHNPDIRFADGSRPMSAGIIEWLFAHPKP